MQTRPICTAFTLSAFLALPSVTFAAGGVVVPGGGYGTQQPNQTYNQVLKFVSSGEQMVMGHKRIVVVFAPMTGNGSVRAYVPTKDPNSAEPREDVATPVANLKQGEVADVTMEMMNGMMTISRIKVVDVKPGEENPHGFVYQESYSDQQSGAPIVRLTKYGQTVEVTLPSVKGEKGKLEVDPDLVNSVQGLKPGDVVYAQIIQQGRVPVLTAIFPYQEPALGKVTKVSEEEVEHGKTAAVEIETADGKSVTAMVPGKVTNKRFVADPNLTRLVKSFKPGTQVQYMSHDDNGKTYLIDISKAPPAPKVAPTPKPEMKGK